MKDEADTPDVFLRSVAKALREGDADEALAEILTLHILQSVPAQNAVVSARDSILKLAADRAKNTVKDDRDD